MNPAPPVTRTEPDNGRLDALRPGKLGYGHRELAPLRSESRAASLEGGSLIRLGEREIVRVENQVDPMLIKAIIWRESSFHPEKVGTKGERGLMQITILAANEWAKAQKIQTFKATDLFDPKTNIEAGTWYFKQAYQRWSGKNDPIIFALAEYNAGHSNVMRWVASTNMPATAEMSSV